jgi:hypothetical protein
MKELVKEFHEKENPKRASLGSLGANQRINQLASKLRVMLVTVKAPLSFGRLKTLQQ